MKKTILSVITLLMASLLLPAAAQEVEVVQLQRLLDGEARAYYPVLNATGDQLLFNTENGALKLYDFNNGATANVTGEFVAGHDACFGGDGKVYFVTQQLGEDRLVYRSGMSYDPATHQVNQLTEPQHGAVRAVAATKGAALRAPQQNYDSRADIGTAAWTEGSRVHVTVNGEDRVFAPVDSWAGYLWASLSPDGKRVAFFAAGKGIVVIDLRGQMLAMLGNYEMPCWYNDNYIVAQHATDDGHQITSSQLLLLKADGTFKTELTASTSMAMHPTCGGGKIVYASIDGLLYQMNINILE